MIDAKKPKTSAFPDLLPALCKCDDDDVIAIYIR